MRVRSSLLVPVLLMGLAACGGDSPTSPTQSYENISGPYTGILGGSSQGVAANLTFSLSINQSSGSLSGTFAIAGTLSDGAQMAPVQGTGALTGTIASGNNPSVNITVTPGGCPNRAARFSGAYDSVNHRLTISGPVEFFDTNCGVVLTYPSTIILAR